MADKIPLTQGKYAIVDHEDFEWLNQWKWHYMNGYAYHSFKINGKYTEIGMHAFILQTPKGMETDHVNRNRSDNRRSNLRVVTTSQNQHNVGVNVKNTSGHKGITFHKRDRYWQVMIRIAGRRFYIGSYKEKDKAIVAYNIAERKAYG